MNVNFFIAKRRLREFERSHLNFIASIEDLDLVWAIGYGQGSGRSLGLKELASGEYGSPKTIQRRLDRLRHLGIVEQQKSDCDARRAELQLSTETLKQLESYKLFIIENGVVAQEQS